MCKNIVIQGEDGLQTICSALKAYLGITYIFDVDIPDLLKMVCIHNDMRSNYVIINTYSENKT